MPPDDIDSRLSLVEARAKSNTHRLDKVEERQEQLEELTASVKVLAVKQEGTENEIKEVKEDTKEIKETVQCLREKPGKRWDAIVDKAVWAVLAAVIAFLLAKIGL